MSEKKQNRFINGFKSIGKSIKRFATTKNKAKDIVGISFYVLIISALALTGSFLFLKNYYSMCYVDGQSMYPTFNKDHSKGIYDLGLFDKHSYALDSLKRFDIVTTYYADDYYSPGKLSPHCSSKIKRLLAFPNESIKIEGHFEYIMEKDEQKRILVYETYLKKEGETEYTLLNLPFDNKISYENQESSIVLNKEIVLGPTQYAVKGDNWGYKGNWNSKDSFTGAGPVERSYLIGKYIALIGTCSSDGANPKYFFPRFYYHA